MITTTLIWHDAKEELPAKNGEVIACTQYGKVIKILFAEGKWNAYVIDGELHDENALEPGYVTHWAYYPKASEMVVTA